MKKIFRTFKTKTKTTSTLKRAYSAYSRNFMEVYGPAIRAGVNPFM